MGIGAISLSARQELIKLYKEMKNNVCEGYSCEFCNICPLGKFYEEKDDEKKGCNEYQRQITEYNDIYNQSNYKEKIKNRKK